METIEIQERQRAKSSQAQLLRVLAQDYALVPRIAQAVMQEVHDYLLADHGGGQSGQVSVNLACHNAGHGQSLQKIGTVSVRWTVDAGESDKEIGRSQGQIALRRHRIVRLLDEATAQGGLAEALGMAVRTIKRDFAHQQAGPYYLQKSSAVGAYPQGESPFGVQDMSGNVWEWCLNEYGKPDRIQAGGDASRVLRGGSWSSNFVDASARSRIWSIPSRSYDDGFRVVLVFSVPIFLSSAL